jgi:predicted butyrate kinase (DUF1464 family)
MTNETLNCLRGRLAVASERNRANGVYRAERMAEAKEKYGTDTLEELRALAVAKGELLVKLEQTAKEKEAAAEAAVAAVEAAVGSGVAK